MKTLLVTLALLCATTTTTMAQNLCTAPQEDPGLPLIQEEVDEICVIQTADSDHCRVVFFRGESVLATRLVVDEMIWTCRDGQYVLIWQDYWTAERVISSKNFSVWQLDEDPTQQGQNGPWWCMFRNMRDLKAP